MLLIIDAFVKNFLTANKLEAFIEKFEGKLIRNYCKLFLLSILYWHLHNLVFKLLVAEIDEGMLQHVDDSQLNELLLPRESGHRKKFNQRLQDYLSKKNRNF